MDKETTLDIDMSNTEFEDDTLSESELAEKYNITNNTDEEDYF